jgi:hypothetical protein
MLRGPNNSSIDTVEQGGCKIFFLNRSHQPSSNAGSQSGCIPVTKSTNQDISMLYQAMRDLAATRALLSRLNREAAYLRIRLNSSQG